MKRLRIFLLGFAVFSLCAPLAQAQDYYKSDGGLYWGVRGGLSQVRHKGLFTWPLIDPDPNVDGDETASHEELRNLEMDYGYVAGASIGYTFAYPESAGDIRVELEGIYRKNDDGQTNADWVPTSDGFAIGHVTSPIDGSIEVRSAMLNVLLDLHTPTRFTPFVGVGAGISQVVVDALLRDIGRAIYGHPYPIVADETIYALSWQATIGVGYHLSPGTMLTLEFRHFELAADRWSDIFRTEELSGVKFEDWSIGARFTF